MSKKVAVQTAASEAIILVCCFEALPSGKVGPRKGDNMAEDATNGKTMEEDKGSFLKNLGVGAWVGIAIATLVVGLLIGHFVMGGGAGGSLNKTKLTESELDTTVASYSYNGASTNVTAREVLEQNGTLDGAKDEEGNYGVPSADTVISYARTQIIVAEAEKQGISVSDEDRDAFAEEMLGSSDYESIASSYGMEEEDVKDVLTKSAMQNKLREQVVGDTDTGTMPEAPTAPEVQPAENAEGEEGQTDEAAQEAANNEVKKEYADYIIKLAGDQWDKKKGEWKDKEGSYATALADYEVTKDGASYNAAQAAYYVAYQEYTTKQTEVSQKWSDYVNELLGNSSIQIYTLKS